MRAPIHIDLTAGDVSTSRYLGILADALLTQQSDRVLISLGKNASNAQVTSTLGKWSERNERLLRTRVAAMAVVVPNLWARLQFRLFLLISQPPAPSSVHGTEAQARRWLETLVARR
jgi:hypothetical protein